MKWKIPVFIPLCLILVEVVVSKTIKKSALIRPSVDVNGSLNVTRFLSNDSTNRNKGIQKNENIYDVPLCEKASSIAVVIPTNLTLRLSCGLNNFTNTTDIVWNKDEMNVMWNDTETDSTLMYKSTSKTWLEFTNVSLGHSGNYSCSVHNKTCHTTILINVKVIPVISEGKRHLQVLNNLTQQSLLVGSNATFYSNASAKLNCNAKGFPLPTITWLVNDEVVTEEDEVMGIFVRNNSLMLKDVAELSGAYTCIASNAFGSDNATSFIQHIVKVIPVISEGKRDLQVLNNLTQQSLLVGSNATFYSNASARLDCNAKGFPLPTITWLVNDEVVTEEDKVMGISVENNSLMLKDVTELSGAYTCIASNAFGTDNATSFIQHVVKVIPVISEGKRHLEVLNNFTQQSLLVGSDATFYSNASVRLDCNAKGFPLPTITWLVNDEVVTEDDEVMGIFVQNNSLMLKDVTELSGAYTCIASNAFGSDNATSFIQHIVKVIPVISEGKRHLQVLNNFTQQSLLVGSDATFYSNASVRLDCNAKGFPLPTITWLVNDEVVTEEDKVMGISVQNNSLMLKDVTELSGAYTCIASNAFGSDNATSFIQHIDPEAPQIHGSYKSFVFIEKLDNTSVTVGCNATVYTLSVLVLICNASGSPRPKIHWFKNGRKILGSQICNKSKLYLSHDPAQTGAYSCEARNFMGSTNLSSYIEFIEPKRPVIVPSRKELFATNGENHVFLKIGDNLTTIAGTAIDIQCLVSGTPKPNITWYLNGRACQDSDLTSLSEESYFHHDAISTNANGNYTCVAENAFGKVSVTSHINAIEPVMPYINSSEDDVAAYEMTHPLGKIIGGSLKCLVGASIWLDCPMGGIPAPDIVWEKDNLHIFSGKRIKVSLKRIEVLGTMMSDTGWYSCTASNAVGKATKATFVHLIVPEKPRIKRVKHKGSYIVDNMPTPFTAPAGIGLHVLAHRKVTIHCSATGFPKPELSWLRNKRPIVEEDGVFVSESGDKLIFKYLEIKQGGEYSCVASNAAGNDIARTMVVGRQPATPQIEITKAVLSNKHQFSPRKEMKVYEILDDEPMLVRGSSVILECAAKSGYPKAVFEWFKDGRPIRRRTKEMFNRSKLKIRNVQKADEGTYKCFASNIMGQHEQTIELRLYKNY